MNVWNWLLLVCFLCGAAGLAYGQPTTPTTPAIRVFSGDKQSGVVGTQLKDDLIVQAQLCRPAPFCAPVGDGTPIEWTVTSGGGSLFSRVTSTTGGLAHNLLTLGPDPGTQTVKACFTFIEGETKTTVCTVPEFTATATAVSATPPVCSIGATPSGTVFAGTPVTLTVSCDPPADPAATYLWSNGKKTASITETPAATTVYTVKVTQPSGAATTVSTTVVVGTGLLKIVSGDNQAGTPGEVLKQPLVVQAVLSTGAPISGQSVKWSVTLGSGSVTQTESITDASGLASTQFVPGNEIGLQRVRATLGSLPPVEFLVSVSQPTTCTISASPSASIVLGAGVRLTADCGPAVPSSYLWSNGERTQTINVAPTTTTTYTVIARLASGFTTQASITVAVKAGNLKITGGDNQVALANTSLPSPLSVKVVDSSDSPVPGITVNWEAAPGDELGSATSVTDATGIATNTLKLGPDVRSRTVTASIAGGAKVVFSIKSAEIFVLKPAQSLVAPLTQAAITVPRMQLDNIRRHLDDLRLGGRAGATNGLSARVGGQAVPLSMLASLASRDRLADSGTGGEEPEPADVSALPKQPTNWGVFVNGEIEIGKQDSIGSLSGYKLRTKGVTIGADYQFPNNNVLGGAVGYTKSDTDIDGGGTQNTDGYSLSMFGSLVPFENAYITGIFNYGHNRYETHRQVSDDETLNATTQGNQFALSLSAGYDFKKGPLTIGPYGRLDEIVATIDSLSENGSANAIQLGSQRIHSTVISLGGQGSYALHFPFGTMIPTLRMEFQRELSNPGANVNAKLVADPLQTSFQVPAVPLDKSFGNVGAGILFNFTKGFAAFFDYEHLLGHDSYNSDRFTLGFRLAL